MAFNNFDRELIRLLPVDWVINFRAYEALEFYGVSDYIHMLYNRLSPEQLQSIMKLCIKKSKLEDDLTGDTPYDVLENIYSIKRATDRTVIMGFYKYAIPPGRLVAIQDFLRKGKFNGELYGLTRSSICNDQERILLLFCNEPARKIQQAWKKYQRIQAIKKIQRKAIEWLYKPGGIMMKKAEAHFNTMVI